MLFKRNGKPRETDIRTRPTYQRSIQNCTNAVRLTRKSLSGVHLPTVTQDLDSDQTRRFSNPEPSSSCGSSVSRSVSKRSFYHHSLTNLSAVAITICLLFSDERMNLGLEKKILTTHPWQNTSPHRARPPKSGYVNVSVTRNHRTKRAHVVDEDTFRDVFRYF